MGEHASIDNDHLVCPVCDAKFVRSLYCAFDGTALQADGRHRRRHKTAATSHRSEVAACDPLEEASERSRACSKCGRKLHDKFAYCPVDGGALRDEDQKPRDLHCPSCKRQFKALMAVCPHDGSLLLKRNPNPLGTFETLVSARNCQYTITGELASGSMSTIFSASENDSGEPVAIKVLSTPINHPDFVRIAQRFKRQEKAHSALNHSNIVALRDQGQTAQAVPFLVFEFVAGAISLEQLRGRLGAIPLGYFVEIFSQVCDALLHAHGQGVFHQDLATNDILIGRAADNGFLVKVTDFAKGHPLLHADNQIQQLTERQDIFGHPEFMSHQTARGEAVDALSNIYSLGAIMYAVLSEHNPFAGAHWGAVLLKKITQPVPPLPPLQCEPDLHASLNHLVMKCLDEDPKKRYQSVTALKRALKSLHVEQPELLTYERLRALA